MADGDRVAVIMAGGSGTRFWPLSRADRPKQFLNLMGSRSLIQQTVDRLVPFLPPKNIFVCSAAPQESLLRAQLPELSGWILEPQGRNTAACLMLTTLTLAQRGFPGSTALIVLPADHHIANPEAFRGVLELAVRTAQSQGQLVTLGIRPDRPHTGYGYIEAEPGSDAVRAVHRFVEKPDAARAQEFFESGHFFWNSGIFVWTLETITRAFELFLPDAWRALTGAQNPEQLARIYANLPSLPIDVAVLEKASNVVVLPIEMGWSDIGSWGALQDLQAKDPHRNCSLNADARFIESSDCLVRTRDGKKVALVGVRDLIVIEDGDTLLVVARSHDQKVRQAAEAFSAGSKIPPSP